MEGEPGKFREYAIRKPYFLTVGMTNLASVRFVFKKRSLKNIFLVLLEVQLLDLIHSTYVASVTSRVLSLERVKYFITFIDDHSCYLYAYLLKSKLQR